MSVVFGPGLGRQPGEGALLADTNPVDKAPIVVQAVDNQTGNLMEFRGPAGNVLSSIDISGAMGGAGGAVILAPAASARNVVQPTADDVTPLTVQAHSAANTLPLLSLWTDPTQAFGLNVDANGDLVITSTATTTPVADLSVGRGFNGALTAFRLNNNVDGAGNVLGQFALTGNSLWFWSLKTDTALHSAVQFQPSWLDNAEATRKGKFVWQTRDAAGTREVMQGATNGTQPTIGFLGAAAAVQQAGASAAGIAAVTDANAKAALTAIQAALAAYGLVTSPA